MTSASKIGLLLLPRVPEHVLRVVKVGHYDGIYLIMLEGNLVLAPLDPNIQSILDMGTGTGLWAIDAAK